MWCFKSCCKSKGEMDLPYEPPRTTTNNSPIKLLSPRDQVLVSNTKLEEGAVSLCQPAQALCEGHVHSLMEHHDFDPPLCSTKLVYEVRHCRSESEAEVHTGGTLSESFWSDIHRWDVKYPELELDDSGRKSELEQSVRHSKELEKSGRQRRSTVCGPIILEEPSADGATAEEFSTSSEIPSYDGSKDVQRDSEEACKYTTADEGILQGLEGCQGENNSVAAAEDKLHPVVVTESMMESQLESSRADSSTRDSLLNGSGVEGKRQMVDTQSLLGDPNLDSELSSTESLNGSYDVSMAEGNGRKSGQVSFMCGSCPDLVVRSSSVESVHNELPPEDPHLVQPEEEVVSHQLVDSGSECSSVPSIEIRCPVNSADSSEIGSSFFDRSSTEDVTAIRILPNGRVQYSSPA